MHGRTDWSLKGVCHFMGVALIMSWRRVGNTFDIHFTDCWSLSTKIISKECPSHKNVLKTCVLRHTMSWRHALIKCWKFILGVSDHFLFPCLQDISGQCQSPKNVLKTRVLRHTMSWRHALIKCLKYVLGDTDHFSLSCLQDISGQCQSPKNVLKTCVLRHTMSWRHVLIKCLKYVLGVADHFLLPCLEDTKNIFQDVLEYILCVQNVLKTHVLRHGLDVSRHGSCLKTHIMS